MEVVFFVGLTTQVIAFCSTHFYSVLVAMKAFRQPKNTIIKRPIAHTTNLQTLYLPRSNYSNIEYITFFTPQFAIAGAAMLLKIQEPGSGMVMKRATNFLTELE